MSISASKVKVETIANALNSAAKVETRDEEEETTISDLYASPRDAVDAEINKTKTQAGEESDDDELFQPPPPAPDCSICIQPLPIYSTSATVYEACCGQQICGGCSREAVRATQRLNDTNISMGMGKKKLLKPSCPFCRAPTARTEREYMDRVRDRMKVDDHNAFHAMAGHFKGGTWGMPKSERMARKHYERGAELGNLHSMYCLAVNWYRVGEDRDEAMQRKLYETAAKQGHVWSRHNLGEMESNNGNIDAALKHWIISSSGGHDLSIKEISNLFQEGHLTKEEYGSVLRAFQTAKDDLKSKARTRFIQTKADSVDW
eukprot:CAMPEP_0172312336 /NCGR_PEP_ID=MMETSP1058-20130122/17138_1 /TAXON_ID=83371 /ORGANISM="Detonula confervacea, Strain CCMP 353" /LENGTH=317 /DNA_ID=CAMNT_0013025753 /DNA_START=234 /DNA_END=1184 /DNA_ORIENTATION=-